jgi:DnaK suppressor protein
LRSLPRRLRFACCGAGTDPRAAAKIMSPSVSGSHLPGMTDAQTKKFQDALRANETALKGKLWERDGINVQRTADPADEAQLSLERELSVRALDRDYRLLAAVRSALQRMREGAYGVCQSCDGEISGKRLAALPWVLYCIHCQERVDERTRELPRSCAA